MGLGHLLLGTGALALALFGFSLADADEAHAAETSCGQAVCSVDSTVRGESDWRETVSEGGTPSTGSDGTGGQVTNRTYYKNCDSWIPNGGGTSSSSYPLTPMGCSFRDGGTYSLGQGTVWFTCPSRGDRSANGRISVFKVNPATGEETYAWYYCLYPTDAYAPIERNVGGGKVYTGGEATFYLVGTPNDARNYGSSGTPVSASGYITRGANLSNPEAWIGSWQPSFTAQTGTTNGQPRYGYHRLQWTLDYRWCEKWAYPSWLGKAPRYDCSKGGTDPIAEPYTYACNFNPALQAGIINGAKFIPSECAQGWECVINEPLTIAGNREPITVMRNGEDLAVRYPTPSVRGGGIKDARSWQVINIINDGATPDRQFVSASFAWDKWEAYRQNQTIAFHWASETAAAPFSWRQNYRFTSDFWLPTQSSVGGGTEYKWVMGTAQCPQTVQSPKVTVVRATSGG